MAISFIVFIVEYVILLFLSGHLIRIMYVVFHSLFHSRSVTITIITLLLFPGTVIHELSHLFTAEILGVKTGKLTLAPDSIKGDEISVGAVEVAKTGPLRRTAIGLAPMVNGLLALFVISHFYTPQVAQAIGTIRSGGTLTGGTILIILLLTYLFFAISNAMFSSKTDLVGIPAVLIVVAIIISAFYFVGIRITLTGTISAVITDILSTLTSSLAIVLTINLILFLFFLLLKRLLIRS